MQLKKNKFLLCYLWGYLWVIAPFLFPFPTFAQSVGEIDAPYIIFVGHARDYNNSWVVFRNGLVAGMNRMNLNIELRNAPTGNLDDIENLVNSAIAAKPDGLILTVPREDLARKWVSDAQAQNIPVIVVGSSGIANYEDKGKFPLISIGQNHYQAGFLAGKKLRKQNIEKVLCLVPRTDVNEHLERCRGAGDGLNQSIDVYSLDVVNNNLQQFFEAYLETYPELQTIILTEITILKNVRGVLNSFPKGKDISLVSFGLTRSAAYLIQSKEQLLFSIDSQPFLQGYTAAMIYNNYFRHGIIWGSNHVATGPDIIDSRKVRDIASFAGTIR